MDRLSGGNAYEVIFAAPILFSSFGFHNVIPSLVNYFDRDVKVLRKSILWGTFISLVVYLAWQWLVIGAVPLSAIELALVEGRPATAALQTLTGNPWVMRLGQFFAFFAIVTSMLGVAFSMVDFLGDGLKDRWLGKQRLLLCLLVFIPPLFLTAIDPKIFVMALGFAGGFGEAFLNGIIPVSLVWVGRYGRQMGGREQVPGGRWMLGLLFVLSLVVAGFEIAFVLTT